MNKKIQKRLIRNSILAFSLIFMISSVFALGVTAPYWGDNPLRLSSGETKNIQFELQNMVGGQDASMRASIIKGSEIAQITDQSKDYIVPFGTKDTKVNVRISVPSNAQIGAQYSVTLSFATISQSSSGPVTFGSAFEKSLPVIVSEKSLSADATKDLTSSQNNTWIIAIVVLVVLVILVVIFIRNRKDR